VSDRRPGFREFAKAVPHLSALQQRIEWLIRERGEALDRCERYEVALRLIADSQPPHNRLINTAGDIAREALGAEGSARESRRAPGSGDRAKGPSRDTDTDAPVRSSERAWRCAACGHITLEPEHPADSDCELARSGLDSWDGVDISDVCAQALMAGATATRANAAELAAERPLPTADEVRGILKPDVERLGGGA
jgi:hypothetical protein